MTAVTNGSDFLVSSDPNDALLFSVKYVFCIYYDLQKPLERWFCCI